MAIDYPELINRIASDGHEIACHGLYHDDVSSMEPAFLSSSLSRAKNILERVSGKAVKGFRAPRFSVSRFDKSRLVVIGKIFNYDSSLHFSNASELSNWKSSANYDFLEVPVAVQPLVVGFFSIKLGGSYFKLFPIRILVNAVKKTAIQGLLPVVYLNPYDLYTGYGMLLKWKEMDGVPIYLKLYWFLRQFQWAGLFNKSIPSKIDKLMTEFESIGRLDKLILKYDN